MIIASTSTIYGSGYLEYLLDELRIHFKNAKDILFIPYARPNGISYDDYTKIAAKAFLKIGKSLKGIHTFEDKKTALSEAKGIFVGGGNTFVLVNELYKQDVLSSIKTAVTCGTPYLGTSAGSNICGISMHTTNDMPIVKPPSFTTLELVPFNINPHYLDPNPSSKHMGETRETRIKEFHTCNSQPVVGLREGSWIDVKENSMTLKGKHSARIFEQNKQPFEILSNLKLPF